jgi:hypothetical protein
MTNAVNIAQGGSNNVTMRNRIINGAMVIDQRNAGASFSTGASPTTYTLDRWLAYANAASKYTVQQSSTAPAGFSSSLKVTTAGSTYSVPAGEIYAIAQYIEGYNFADLNFGSSSAKTITLSFWVQSSVTGTFGGSVLNSAYNRSYPFTYTINSANTWEQKSVTIAGDTSGTWVGATNGVGLRVWFGLGVGSTFSGTANAWASAEYESATSAVNLLATASATFYITGVQLEAGTTASPFEYRQYGTELALCQRYYQFYDAGLVVGSITGNAYGVSAFCTVVPRTTPTVSWVSPTLGVNGYVTTTPNITDIKAYSCLVWMVANTTQTGSSWQNRVAFSAEL